VNATPENQLASFIAKFDPKHRTLIRAVRRAMRRRLPSANELVWDNYNFLVIGYSPTERPYDSAFSIAAAANGVGLAFLYGASLPDPHNLLQGSGSRNRFIRLDSVKVLDRPAVKALIAAAMARNRVPYSRSGRGALIIRSISKKQKPRRRSK
jgi:Domain of unknown function (DU1801)